MARMVELLVESGADVNETRDGDSPLSLAGYFGHKEVVNLLLENKEVNVELKSKISRGGSFRLLSPLARVARRVDDIGDWELSHTHTTHQRCCYEIIELLLKRGADVNSKGSSGYTPLMWLFDGYGNRDFRDEPLGAMSFNIEIVELFLAQEDIDINRKVGGKTALSLAVEYGLDEAAEISRKSGAV